MATAPGNVSRTLKRGGTIDSGAVQAIEHNAYAGAKKIIPVGPEFFPTNGQDASVTPVSIKLGTIIGLYNNSSTVAWASLANEAGTPNTPVTPTGFTNAIALKPNDWTWINSGANNLISTSASTVGVYTIKDDSVYQVVPIP